jgi:hypothetical protein
MGRGSPGGGLKMGSAPVSGAAAGVPPGRSANDEVRMTNGWSGTPETAGEDTRASFIPAKSRHGGSRTAGWQFENGERARRGRRRRRPADGREEFGVIFGPYVCNSDGNGGAESWNNVVQQQVFRLRGHRNSLGWGWKQKPPSQKGRGLQRPVVGRQLLSQGSREEIREGAMETSTGPSVAH